jgi:hypothetical protein
MNQAATLFAKMQTLILGVGLGAEVLARFSPVRSVGMYAVVEPERLQWYCISLALGLNLVFIWMGRKEHLAETRGEGSRDATIDRLYAELRQLMSHPEGSELEIEQRLAHLRTLQQEEAAAMRQRYEDRSHLKPGTGWQALSQARKLLSENENPSSANPTLPKQA